MDENNDRELVNLEGGLYCWLNADERNAWREALFTIGEYGRLIAATDLKEMMLARMPRGGDIIDDDMGRAYQRVCENILTEKEALYRTAKEWHRQLIDPPFRAVAVQEDKLETEDDEFFCVFMIEDIPKGCHPVEVSFNSEGDIETRLRCGENTWPTMVSTGLDLEGDLVMEFRPIKKELVAIWNVVMIVGEE